MVRIGFAGIVRIAVASTLLQIVSVPAAHAQAYLPAQGEGSISFLFQDQFFKYHFAPIQAVDAGQIYVKSMLYDITYGVTDKLAVNFGLPMVSTRYAGPSPHPLPDFSGPNPIDNGKWHSTAQDFRFDVRYNVTRNLGNKGIVLTPFVGSVLPSHDYPYFVHAGFGRRLKEVQLGASAAKLFERGIPGLLIQGRYAYGLVERAVDISHNRSILSLEAAYFVTPKLRVLGMTGGQRTHGGIDFYGAASRAILTPTQFLHHDQIQRENMLTVGGGASYTLTESIDLFGTLAHTVSQRNGHGLTRGVTLGLSWSFMTPRAKNHATMTTAENTLARCLCEKGTK
jgi:hypothetical protein